MTSVSSMYKAGHSKPVLWNNLVGWGGWGKRERCSGWKDTRAPMTDSCQYMVKVTKILESNYFPIKINKQI